MIAELAYKNTPRNSWLWLRGGYADKGLKAGWVSPMGQPPRLPVSMLTDDMVAETFEQPTGSDLFGGSTEREWKANLAGLRKALAGFGVKVGRPRRAKTRELI